MSREERLSIEKEFYNKRIEVVYNDIYNMLVDENVVNISPREKRDILFVIISFYFRNRIHLENFESKAEETIKFFKQFIERSHLNDKNGEVFGNFNGRRYKFKANELSEFEKEVKGLAKFDFLVGQINGLNTIVESKMISGISISRLVDADFEFITSDIPVSLYTIKGKSANIYDEDCIIALPIDNKHLVTIYPEKFQTNPNKIGRTKATRNNALVANLQTEQNHKLWIIGNEISIKKHENDQVFFGEDNLQNRENVENINEAANYLMDVMTYLEKIGSIRLYDRMLYEMIIEGVKRGYLKSDPNFADFVQILETEYRYQFPK